MAESVKQKCSNCKKMGMIRCDGCTHRFCTIHFNEHRQHLDTLFEHVCNDRDTLCEQINNPGPVSTSNNSQRISLLNEITEWENKTLQMVKQTAERAREQINELMVSNKKTAAIELDKLSKELRKHKEDDDYFEQDIEILSKKLKQIQIDLNVQPPHIQINVTSVDWSTLIQIGDGASQRSVIDRVQNHLFVGGTLLTIDHQIQLNRFYGNENQNWQLIYKGTKNGFDAMDCHRHIDNQGPTLTVVQSSEGYLFGGYTSVSWGAIKGDCFNDKTAFLFTLTNPHNILPTKYMINSKGENAILSNFINGPAFGSGDIWISLKNDKTGISRSRFPRVYIDSTKRGKLTFTGSSTFLIIDIEIYHPIS
jgi:hypothetical protein